MKTASNPIHRKVIVPWYDSDMLCMGVVVTSVLVMLFGVVGVVVAVRNPAYAAYGWVPKLIIILSLWVFVSVGNRLIRRSLARYGEDL